MDRRMARRPPILLGGRDLARESSRILDRRKCLSPKGLERSGPLFHFARERVATSCDPFPCKIGFRHTRLQRIAENEFTPQRPIAEEARGRAGDRKRPMFTRRFSPDGRSILQELRPNRSGAGNTAGKGVIDDQREVRGRPVRRLRADDRVDQPGIDPVLDRRPANALPGSANADAGRKTAGTATATAIPVDAVAVNVSLDGGGRSRRGTRPPLAPRLSSGHARRETLLLPGGNGRDRLDDDRAGAPAPHHDDEQLIPGRRRGRDDLAQPDFPRRDRCATFMRTRFAGPRRFDRADAGERRRHRRTLVRISEHAPSSRRDDGFGLDDERPIAVELLLDREPRHQPFVSVVSAAVCVAIGRPAALLGRCVSDAVAGPVHRDSEAAELVGLGRRDSLPAGPGGVETADRSRCGRCSGVPATARRRAGRPATYAVNS